MTFSRRKFLTLAGTSAAGTVLMSPLEALYGRIARGESFRTAGYGSLIKKLPENVRELPAEYQMPLLELPRQFRYTAFSIKGTPMSDGTLVPGDHDGMAAFPGPRRTTILVRNHELSPGEEFPVIVPPGFAYDPNAIGGTTTLVVGQNNRLIKDYASLSGCIRNCSGGPTPWGTWISCEENTSTPPEEDPQNPPNNNGESNVITKPHGYCFEVDPRRNGPVVAEPIIPMGRFNHEAICVDPRTGIVYQTEDRGDSVFYRYIPNERGNLRAGGVLEALKIVGMPAVDTKVGFPLKTPMPVEWVSLEDLDITSPEDNLRLQAASKGAAIFTRGEGIAYGDGEVYFCCTDGGEKELGQVWRYVPDVTGATGGTIELFVEPNEQELLDGPDNITVSPFGDLFVCEDGMDTDYIVGITQDGKLYDFVRNAINNSEFAGVCFSPDGQTMFFNIQTPGITFAVSGPFRQRRERSQYGDW
jgi:secreted PhoX family phosphatase